LNWIGIFEISTEWKDEIVKIRNVEVFEYNRKVDVVFNIEVDGDLHRSSTPKLTTAN
jgi:hypothetical protein